MRLFLAIFNLKKVKKNIEKKDQGKIEKRKLTKTHEKNAKRQKMTTRPN